MAQLYVIGFPNATDASVTTTAAKLADGITPVVNNCQEVLIRADAGNTADILFGDVNAQNWPLHKDEVVSVKTNDITSIYRKSASGTQKLVWWARTLVSDVGR